MAMAFIVRRGSYSPADLPPAPLLLFDGGNDLSAVSGGWIRHSGEGSIREQNGVLLISQAAKSYGYRWGYFRCSMLQDFAERKKLSLSCDPVASVTGGNAMFCVLDSGGNLLKSGSLSTGATGLSLDISELSGSGYVGFYLESYYDGVDAVSTSLSVKRILLE